MRSNSYFPEPQRVFDKEAATKIRAIHARHVAHGALYEERITNLEIFRAEDRAAQIEAAIDHAHINRALAETYGYGAPIAEIVEPTASDNFHAIHVGELILSANLAI